MSKAAGLQRMIAPDTMTTPRANGLGGRILAAIGGGLSDSDGLRQLFGVRGAGHPYHQRLSELVDRGWVVHTVSLTEAGKEALARMSRRS